MFRFRVVAFLVLATCGALAQMPLRVSGHEIREVEVTASASPGFLLVDLDIADGWRAYSRDVGGGNPVLIELAEDCDFVVTGPVKLPEAYDGKIIGSARWQLPIKSRGEGKDLRAVVWFQICDELECYAPTRVDVVGDPRSMSVLLVVGEPGERSLRIETFLKGRGFKVAVTTYEKVQSSDCEQCDVVLADSKLFRKTARVRQHVLKFPQSETPIVAVGFFGTELIEAHGIAMTSGYI